MKVEFSQQDEASCHLCETPAPREPSDVCGVHLCEDGKGKHLSDESEEHKLVLVRHGGLNFKCVLLFIYNSIFVCSPLFHQLGQRVYIKFCKNILMTHITHAIINSPLDVTHKSCKMNCFISTICLKSCAQ